MVKQIKTKEEYDNVRNIKMLCNVKGSKEN
jgi:hypothetical protein